MRISYWSSDVCSSDLERRRHRVFADADGAADEVLRPRDAAVGADEEGGVAEAARRENGDQAVGRIAARDPRHVVADGQLGHVDRAPGEGAGDHLLDRPGVEGRAYTREPRTAVP